MSVFIPKGSVLRDLAILGVTAEGTLIKQKRECTCICIVVYPVHSVFSICLSVSQSVCLLTDWLSNDYVHNFFTDFHKILHAAQKCGRFDT